VNINAATPLRSVNYMVDQICQPIHQDGLHLPHQIERRIGRDIRQLEGRALATSDQTLGPDVHDLAGLLSPKRIEMLS
jgi:hypothetical protein